MFVATMRLSPTLVSDSFITHIQKKRRNFYREAQTCEQFAFPFLSQPHLRVFSFSPSLSGVNIDLEISLFSQSIFMR